MAESQTNFQALRTARMKFFHWRTLLDENPGHMSLIRYSLGVFLILHPVISYLLVMLKVLNIQVLLGLGYIQLSLIPLILLCLEISVACVASFMVFYKDLEFRKKKGVATWHREALGRILRNMIVSIMVFISLVLMCFSLDNSYATTRSVLCTASPVIVLCVLSIIKICCVTTAESPYWLGLCVLTLAQLTLFALKLDYGAEIYWSVVLSPMMMTGFNLLIWSLTSSSLSRNISWLDIISILGYASITASFGSLGLHLDFSYFSVYSVWVNMSLSVLLVSIGKSYKVGSWAYDIIFGHLETDYIYKKNPVRKRRPKVKGNTYVV
jgi:hypothetical protein